MKRNTQTRGQHFLRSPELARKLITLSSLSAKDTVFDIGAGSGVITSALAPKVHHVVAVEVDQKMASILRRNITDVHHFTNVSIVTDDFLSMQLPKAPFKVFANIPFHISAAIVRRFFNSQQSPEAAYLIVQKQFGQKLVASEGKYFTSQLGMLLGAEYAVKVIAQLKRSDFSPPPGVDTVCIEMKKRKTPLVSKNELKKYEQFTIDCFADPKILAKQPLEILGLKPGDPPSRLTISQWVLLFNSRKTHR